ncbi:response regulator [Maribellus comscasis]|uniref:Response regulator n=1 Tax=Maribellus comscasis TaxID=2681766 RepID=A0A6I6K1X6_9BACT|nr:response regulator [Maribellus comscasis]QGY45483.1 response regulator [Maribellus comscasis]
MKINCIAIEDEPLALKKLVHFIHSVEYLHLLKGFENAIDAIAFLKIQPVDLIFLDIRMKKLSGIQFLEALHVKPKIIITSAYQEYALKGFELEISDYLLKPFTFERFLKSTEKIFHEIKERKTTDINSFFFLKTENRIEKIEFDSILYIKGMRDYLQVVTSEKKRLTLQSFKNILSVLPENQFARVHNSYIISISKISSIEKNRIRIGNQLIPISDSYKESFYELLRQYKYLL